MVGGDCFVNHSLKTVCNVSVMGYNSYELSCAIEKWINDRVGIASAISCSHELMSQIIALKKLEKLGELTHLIALLPNGTLWLGK